MRKILLYLIIFTALLSIPVYGDTGSGADAISKFEEKYDLTDRNLRSSSIDYKSAPYMDTAEEIQQYFKSCLEKDYKYVVFSTNTNLGKSISFDSTDTHEGDSARGYYDIKSLSLIKYYKKDRTYCIFTVTYNYSHEIIHALKNNSVKDLNKEQLAALSVAQDFTNKIKDKSTYEKELAIHNFVCSKITYVKDESLNNIRDCYGGLVLGRGVCSAYADSFNLLCYLSGIESGSVEAVSDENSLHEFNYVILNGRYYFVDCTFDDGAASNINQGIGLYYFNVPLSVVTEKYTIPYLPFKPVLELDDMYYFKRNNIYFGSLAELSSYVDGLVARGLDKNAFPGEIVVNVGSESDDNISKTFSDLAGKLHASKCIMKSLNDYRTLSML